MKSFGEKLIAARKHQGMTQNQLAERMNVVRSTISNWEIGRAQPGYDALCQLAHILHYDFLLDRKEDEHIADHRSPLSDQSCIELYSSELCVGSRIQQLNSLDIRINGINYRGKETQLHIFIPFKSEKDEK